MKQLTLSHFPTLSYAGQEAINTLCTNLTFSGEHVKKIMVTSSHGAEGKSFVSMNILRTMARYGKTVALVDADLRMSSMEEQYGLHFEQPEHRLGLAHLLAGMTDESEVVYQTNLEGTYMVPIGKTVSAPMPLLNSPRFPDLLAHLAQMCDYVLIDAPPVGAVIDAAEIAKSCDGILVVVDYDEVHRQELVAVKQQLEQTGCPVLGAVLNQVEQDGFFSRKYYNASFYSGSNAAQGGHSKAKKERRHKRR